MEEPAVLLALTSDLRLVVRRGGVVGGGGGLLE